MANPVSNTLIKARSSSPFLSHCSNKHFRRSPPGSWRTTLFLSPRVLFILSLNIWSHCTAIPLEALILWSSKEIKSVFFPSGLFSSRLSEWTGVLAALQMVRWKGWRKEREKNVKRKMLYHCRMFRIVPSWYNFICYYLTHYCIFKICYLYSLSLNKRYLQSNCNSILWLNI